MSLCNMIVNFPLFGVPPVWRSSCLVYTYLLNIFIVYWCLCTHACIVNVYDIVQVYNMPLDVCTDLKSVSVHLIVHVPACMHIMCVHVHV